MTMRIVAALLLGLLTACTAAKGPDYAAIVAAPDRTEADRQTDQRRKPEVLLAFTGAAPGMKVLDMGAGGGYSTELIARTVGPTGTVYAQDSAENAERMRERFDVRLQKPVAKNVVRTVRPFDDPLPAEVRDLDLITFFFFYHDTTYMAVDRARMNRRLFEALKPGGVLVIADHSAVAGAGTAIGNTLHRIEEAALRREVEAAGFRLIGEGNFLRSPQDSRPTRVFRPESRVDEFVLTFQKPR
jgi:predicted methyltransferase